MAKLYRDDLAGSMSQDASAEDDTALNPFFSLLQKNKQDRRR